jgi:hypothetical protein
MRITDGRPGEGFGAGVFFDASIGRAGGVCFFTGSRLFGSGAFCRGEEESGLRFEDLEAVCFFGIVGPSKIDGQDSTDPATLHEMLPQKKAQRRCDRYRNALRSTASTGLRQSPRPDGRVRISAIK